MTIVQDSKLCYAFFHLTYSSYMYLSILEIFCTSLETNKAIKAIKKIKSLIKFLNLKLISLSFS